MTDLFSHLDPTITSIILGVIGTALTQLAKRLHTDPKVIFGIVCFLVALVYVFFILPLGADFVAELVAKFLQVSAIASGIWHWLLRPESDLQKYLKKVK